MRKEIYMLKFQLILKEYQSKQNYKMYILEGYRNEY